MNDALGRIIRRARAHPGPVLECCDLCAVEVPHPHRHLLDLDRHEVRCVCQACSLLFGLQGRMRLVPRRRLRLPEMSTDELGVPVGLAFFVPHDDATVAAHYPGPAGPTRWEVDPAAWRTVVAGCAPLAGLAAEVEALLVDTTRDRSEHWLVPIDDCFALVALVRREWRGLSGGSRVWPEIDRFFAALTEQRR